MIDSDSLIVPLRDADTYGDRLAGGKAANLARLIKAGFTVPGGYCLTTNAYRLFIDQSDLARKISLELNRKQLEKMRWEELWDAALRIRSVFLTSEIPESVSAALIAAHEQMFSGRHLVVRSSAPGEDSAQFSFAGLHESVVGVEGVDQLLRAVRVVWASLWSDAALLYRREMDLDPERSSMAVVIQELFTSSPSGVAFGRDPRDSGKDTAIIEAVPGLCRDLVDGLIEPDRWVLERSSGAVLDWRAGSADRSAEKPLLAPDDLKRLLDGLLSIESIFGWPPDTEWTDRGDRLTYLQVRPITSGTEREQSDDQRQWYLSLRPGSRRLEELADRISGELIPELQQEGDRLAAQEIESFSDKDLAAAIKERLAAVRKWKKIYFDEFIPFAHGVRQLGSYYNTAMQPENPYEFLDLLKGEDMLASTRNRILCQLAEQVVRDPALETHLWDFLSAVSQGTEPDWISAKVGIRQTTGGIAFTDQFDALLSGQLDVSFKGERLHDHPEMYAHAILELVNSQRDETGNRTADVETDTRNLEQRLFDAVGESRIEEAKDIIRIGRLSWKLRDDDNLLVGRLESQLVRALQEAANRLQAKGLIAERQKFDDQMSIILAEALLDPPATPIELPESPPADDIPNLRRHEGKPRQLTGQPAAPGIATGLACTVRETGDLMKFHAGQVLICDAIQPTMTHIVPLASAVVERRGGMLIHGAIIARELGIPCVNGVADAVKIIEDGELVTVDGYLGIVTVGPPEFTMETGG